MHKATLEKVSWQEIRATVRTCNTKLYEIIEEINPGNRFPLFLAKYPFGSEILKQGVLQLPDAHGVSQPINSDHIPPTVRNALDYNDDSNPCCLVLKNSVELFIQMNKHVIPFYAPISPGKVFGTWRVLSKEQTLHPVFIWEMTAGARSVFMLPKISRHVEYQKLRRELLLKSDVPKGLLDHWQVFREIDANLHEPNPWAAEVLFFSKPWFSELNTIKWSKFYNYLFESAWSGSEARRNQFVWDIVFATIQESKNIDPDPYIFSIVKQLFSIGSGTMPGFAPVIDELACPAKKLQRVYSEIYKLDYAPILMQPLCLDINQQYPRSIYYSLEFLTTIETSMKSRIYASKMVDLNQIYHIMHKIQDAVLIEKLKLDNTAISVVLKNIMFDYIHDDIKQYNYLTSSEKLPLLDPTFMQDFPDSKFPINSPFLRGCVRVHTKGG